MARNGNFLLMHLIAPAREDLLIGGNKGERSR